MKDSSALNNCLLNVNEIAALLNVSNKTIYWWVNRSEIPFVKVGKHLRFEADKVLNFFRERTEDLRPHQPCLPPSFALKSADYCSLKTRARTTVNSLERE